MAKFDPVKAVFSLVDNNKDGSIDPNEFRNWITGGSSAGVLNSSSYTSSSGLVGIEGTSGYDTSYNSQSGFESTGGTALSSSNKFAQTAGTTVKSSNLLLFQDPNPRIIKRAATGGAVTYQQKIVVRFLQPPPIPPPGPLIIKEIRPIQPPPPPPLVVRQQAPSVPQPPPLILRERPPKPPQSVASQTVVRRLAAIPVPPRSVIIERLGAPPAKPRDIIIERWIPYGAQAKRRTIVQRAAAAKEYAKPRNLVIMYDAVQARIVRQFQRLGVTQENPQVYLSHYGASLLDPDTLVQQARAAGVVEDISPPASTQFSASTGYEYSSSSSSQNVSSTEGGTTGFEGIQVVDGSGGENYSSQSYSSSSNYGTEGGLADTNHDGSLDASQFQRFPEGGV